MKRLLRLGILCGVLAALLCVSAFAIDKPAGNTDDVAGVFDVAGTGLTPKTASAGSITANSGFYPLAERFTVAKTGLTANAEYLLLILNAQAAPNDSSIWFIDQTKADNTGAVTFDAAYPKQMASGTTYSVYVIGTGSAFTAASPDATFTYYAPYMLGDVSGDNQIKTNDATMVLKHVAKIVTLEGNDALAADCSGDNQIKTNDATLILKHVAKIIDLTA